MTVHVDLSDGRYLLGVCCLACHCEVIGRYAIAQPAALYVASVDCPHGDPLVEFDAFSHQAMEFDGRAWRAA